jgi:hypothetical protein
MINIWVIIDYIIEQDLFDQLDLYVMADLMFMHFAPFKSSIQNSFRKVIMNRDAAAAAAAASAEETNAIIESEKWKPMRKATFESIEMTKNFMIKLLLNYNRPIYYINKNIYSFIIKLPDKDAETIMHNVTTNAIINLMSDLLSDSTSRSNTFDIVVDPLRMINSSICPSRNLSATIHEFVKLRKKPYIIYDNENGQVGIDAGGLTRDFYSQYFLQLKTHMVEKDEYMTFAPDLNGINSLQRMRFAGIITAYSVFKEKISPNIRFHPIISYFIINGSTVEISNILHFLAKYDIEYVKNIQKIEKLSKEEYAAYLDMQGEEEFIPKKLYFKNLLYDRYITPSFVAFIRGYRDIYTQVDLYSYVKPNMIYDYMIGIESYCILGEKHSLESILKIDTGDNNTLTVKEKQNIKQIFLEVLENLNKTNIPRLKELLRFWHGTHGIQDFEHLDLTLRILYGKDDLYGCFSSSTCFGKLYIHNSHLKLNSQIKNNLIGHIERTLENQKIVESAGMYMQMD